jgi:glyceraldehyde 3-phosphate dehydrogenase
MGTIKVGINGFGRIGRAVFRHIMARPDIEVVAINDLGHNPQNLCYMLKYDSIHGVLNADVQVKDFASTEKSWIPSELEVNGETVRVFSENRVQAVPWGELGVEYLVESTGDGQNLLNARKVLRNGCKRVIVTNAPGDHVDFTFVADVNDHEFDVDKHHFIAASICDVVGMAPVIRRIESKYGVESGFVTTLHPWLSYQNILDSRPSATEFKDKPSIYGASTHLVMGRSSVGNLIPKDTSSALAIEQVVPGVRGKLSGMSYRVPTDVVTTGIVMLQLKTKTTKDEVRDFLRNSAKEPYMSYHEEPLISVDYKHSECSSIVDGKWIDVINDRQLRFVAWYDNEWGYSARVVDLVQLIARLLAKKTGSR